jgi:hypothetical protein
MLCVPTTFDLKKAVCFCGTILTLARTGRYPASLVFRETGLSSDLLYGQIRNCLAYSLIYHFSLLDRKEEISLKSELKEERRGKNLQIIC